MNSEVLIESQTQPIEFAFWKKTKLRNRIAFTASALLLILISIFSIFLYRFLSNDKISYAYDSAFSESESVSMALTQEIYRQLETIEQKTSTFIDESENANDYNLIRWPKKNEIFFGQKADHFFTFARNEDGALISLASDEAIQSIRKRTPPSSVLVTSTGDILEPGKRPMELVKNYVREFMTTGVRKGVHTFEFKNQIKTFSFSQSPSSNIIVVTDAFIEESTRQINTLTVTIFFILVILIIVSTMTTIVFVRRSLSPLNEINEAASQIANGNFGFQFSYDYQDEIAETFHRIDKMRVMLQIRDSKLTRTTDYLSQVLNLFRSTIKESDSRSALQFSLSSIVRPDVFAHEILASYFKDGFEIEVNASSDGEKRISNFFSQSKINALIEDLSSMQGDFLELEENVLLVESEKLIFCNLQVNAKLKEHRGWIILGPFTSQNLDVASIRFLGAFISSVRSTLENIELKNLAVEQGRLQLAFEAASQIQENLSVKSDFPDSVLISSKSQTAETVGGDWIGSFFHRATNTVYCYVTDVTGHGINATLLVASVRGAVETMHSVYRDKTSSEMNDFLVDCSLALDSIIAEVSGGKLSMTMFMMALSLDTGVLRSINFGHPMPLVFNEKDIKLNLLTMKQGSKSHQPNRQITYDSLGTKGISSTRPPQVSESRLELGEILCIYTDGLVECTNSTGAILGRRKARDILSTALQRNSSLSDSISEIYSEVGNYCSGRPLDDDVSLLLLKRSGK